MYARRYKSQSENNRDQGALFESVFYKRAQMNGMAVIKNYLTCRFLPGGIVKVIHGELDFKLITDSGKVGYFDCKSYNADYFTYSMLKSEQIDRSLLYNERKVPSGFIVWFINVNKVVFFSGYHIAMNGPRSRFSYKDGLSLGSVEFFDVRPLFQPLRKVSRLREA